MNGKRCSMANQRGRSMVEMLGVLAIMGVLSIGGIAGFNLAMNRIRAYSIMSATAEIASKLVKKTVDKDSSGQPLPRSAYLSDINYESDTVAGRATDIAVHEVYDNGKKKFYACVQTKEVSKGIVDVIYNLVGGQLSEGSCQYEAGSSPSYILYPSKKFTDLLE